MSEKPTFVAPGSMVGPYRITELIGKGGFSEVWSSWDTRLQRLVAIKLVARSSTNPHTTIQFRREANVVIRLEHPHILPLYDFGETENFRFLTMRYVTGGSLAQRMARDPLPISEVLRLITAIAETLDYIHDQNVVHRDLKPGNILLDAQSAPYLTDFGLAKELSEETKQIHSAAGTLTYMPPEQFTGGVITRRSDLYSFGMMLFQLFAGDLPYEGKVAFGLRQISSPEKLPDVTLLNPVLPARLNEMLWKLTDPDPTKRPDSAGAAMREIAELMKSVQGVETETVPTSAPAITFALESGAYRQREAESLIQQDLPGWQQGKFTLSLTHFVLLDVLLLELNQLITPEVCSLMLRASLEYNQQIERWWKESQDDERRRACWHAIANGAEPVLLRALRLASTMPWAREADVAILSNIGKRLMPISDFTEPALSFLERALPKDPTWESPPVPVPATEAAPDSTTQEEHPPVAPAAPDGSPKVEGAAVESDPLAATDDNLKALATSKSPLAARAATLIGSARRTRAAVALPTSLAQANSILVVFETAGSLPRSIPMTQRIILLLILALRQLTRDPLPALAQWVWAAAGNSLGTALMIFGVWRLGSVLENARILNSVGNGLLFGLIYATGVWAARHIVLRMRITPLGVRLVLGTLVGGFIVAVGFSLFHRLVYDDAEGIEGSIALLGGVLYVAGFALSVVFPAWVQFVLGTLGVVLAFYVPWLIYQSEDRVPTFYFDESNPDSVVPLSIAAGVLVAAFSLGYLWRSAVQHRLRRRIATVQGQTSPGSDGITSG